MEFANVLRKTQGQYEHRQSEGEVTDEQVTRTIDRMDLARNHGDDRIS